MTEQEWLTSENPREMLEQLGWDIGERKRRLIAAAALRRIWNLLTDPRCRAAAEASEQFAEGAITLRKLDTLSGAAEEAFEDLLREDGDEAEFASIVARAASYGSSPSLSTAVLLESLKSTSAVAPHGIKAERWLQADSLRETLGNPFRPLAFAPSWRSDTAVSLARGMYESRDFAAMPILADALQDAGCEDADVLAHCRGDGVHVRGCWVVDLVLGKT